MDPVTDLPPAARSQQDHLQMIAATLAALAATMDRVAYRRDLANTGTQRDLNTARRELRDALHAAATASGAPRRAAAGGPSRLSTDPAERPPTVGPDQEEALVLAGYYSRRADRLADRRVFAGLAVGRAEPVGRKVAADRWAAYASTLAESDRRGRRWAEPVPGRTPQWADRDWARDRAERSAYRAAGWHAQADLLERDPATAQAAAISRRRAEEADLLVGHWGERADQLDAGATAYAPNARKDDTDLGRGLAALARVSADEGRAADATDVARADRAAAATEAATADVPGTQADEHREGLDRAAVYLERAASATATATRADADATADLAATAKFIAETPPAHGRPVTGAASRLRAANLLHRTGRGREAS